MDRAKRLREMAPHLIADMILYPTSDGGRSQTAFAGWGCPCCISKEEPIVGYDGYPQLGDVPIEPGEQRRVGFVFASGEEAADIMRKAGTFYLWEGRFIGEAQVCVCVCVCDAQRKSLARPGWPARRRP